MTSTAIQNQASFRMTGIICEATGRCEECGCPCDFIEINYEAYFCSEECERAFESRIPYDTDESEI